MPTLRDKVQHHTRRDEKVQARAVTLPRLTWIAPDFKAAVSNGTVSPAAVHCAVTIRVGRASLTFEGGLQRLSQQKEQAQGEVQVAYHFLLRQLYITMFSQFDLFLRFEVPSYPYMSHVLSTPRKRLEV